MAVRPQPAVTLVAVDLDGTLLRSDSTLDPAGSQALAAASQRGVRVVLSTTRTPDTVRRFASEIGLSDPLICTNGAVILASPSGPLWQSRAIPRCIARSLVELADRVGYPLITTVGDVTYYRQLGGEPLGSSRPGRCVVGQNADVLGVEGAVTRVLCYDAEGIVALHAVCSESFSDEVHVETYLRPDGSVKSLGIFAAGSDKGTALRFVATLLDVDLARTMAIGDNPNDLPMFDLAGIRVAMGNATQGVRSSATVVAPSNDEGGVAWAIERYVTRGG